MTNRGQGFRGWEGRGGTEKNELSERRLWTRYWGTAGQYATENRNVNFDEFVRRMRVSLPQGLTMSNPGGGTTTVLSIDESRLCYRRGRSRFCVGLAELYEAFTQHAGKTMSTTDLKASAPAVFDSRHGGHNCHCTVLLLALQRMGLAPGIWGKGRAGAPFGVTTLPS